MKLSVYVAGESNNEKIAVNYANNFSANIKSLITLLHNARQSGRFIGRLLGPLLTAGLSLMNNVLKPLA